MFNGCLRKVSRLHAAFASISVNSCTQVIFALIGMVALGWVLIIIGFSMEVINKEQPVDGPIRYPWWMVIVVTPIMLIMAVVQAAIDNNRAVMNIIGAIVSYLLNCLNYNDNNIIVR